MNILVTGANGQLGNELRALAPQNPAMTFDFASSSELDITNAAQLLCHVEQTRPQFVINCAAYTAVDKAESEPDRAMLVNATAVQHLAAACAKMDAYLLHISTDYVFDGNANLPYLETDATAPQTVYGASKLQGEHFALAYPKSVVVRTSWLYSAWGNNFVKTMLRLGSTKPEIGVVADQVGTPTHAADLARALLQMAETIAQDSQRFVGGVFHFSNEGVCSWYDFAVEIMRLAHLSCRVRPISTQAYPTPARRPAYSVLCKSKIKDTYGIAIPHWRESLEGQTYFYAREPNLAHILCFGAGVCCVILS